jgi:hypothetical protein
MMKDDRNKGGRPGGEGAKDAIRDRREARLKLALRENLKRRKSQARERGDFTPSSSPADDVGKERPDK